MTRVANSNRPSGNRMAPRGKRGFRGAGSLPAPAGGSPAVAIRENRWTVAGAALSLVLLTAWLWSPALSFGFVYDDHLQIESNSSIRSWTHLGYLLREPLWSQLGPGKASPWYRPLFSVLLLVQYSLFGSSPEGWHLVSIALHILVVLALFLFLLLQFGRWLPAFVGACFFAVSPLAAEVVNWLSASDDALYTLLILLALCALVLSTRMEHPRRAFLLRLCCGGLLALAIFAKETAAVGVVLAVVWEYLFATPQQRRNRILFYLALAGLVVVSVAAHPSAHPPDARPTAAAIAAMPYAALLAIRKMLWPLPVSEFYELWLSPARSAISVTLHVTALLAVAGALLWAGMRSRFVGWALLVVTLPLGLSLAGIYVFRDYDLFHDRYLYLSIAGVAMLIAAGVAKVEPQKRILGVVLSALAVVLCGEAWLARSVSGQFRSDISLFSHAVQVAPQNVLAWQLLGDAELRMGDCRAAAGSYRKAEALRPDLWKTAFYLGAAESRCGMNAPAAWAFARAAAISAATTEQVALAWYELGRVRIAEGDPSGAEAALHQAALRDPGSHRIRNLLAQLHTRTAGR